MSDTTELEVDVMVDPVTVEIIDEKKLALQLLEQSNEPVQLEVPRDRDRSFEPVIVPKRKRRLDGIDEIVLSLTAGG